MMNEPTTQKEREFQAFKARMEDRERANAMAMLAVIVLLVLMVLIKGSVVVWESIKWFL